MNQLRESQHQPGNQPLEPLHDILNCSHTQKTARPSPKKNLKSFAERRRLGRSMTLMACFPVHNSQGFSIAGGGKSIVSKPSSVFFFPRGGGKQREKTTKTSGWKPQTHPYGWIIIYTVIPLFTHLGNLVSQVKDNIGRHSFASKTRPRQNNIQWP